MAAAIHNNSLLDDLNEEIKLIKREEPSEAEVVDIIKRVQFIENENGDFVEVEYVAPTSDEKKQDVPEPAPAPVPSDSEIDDIGPPPLESIESTILALTQEMTNESDPYRSLSAPLMAAAPPRPSRSRPAVPSSALAQESNAFRSLMNTSLDRNNGQQQPRDPPNAPVRELDPLTAPKCPPPWGPVVKFIYLLIRSLQLNYNDVFQTAYFRSYIRTISIQLARKHKIAQTADQIFNPTPQMIEIIREWLKRHLMDLLPRFVTAINWCIEKVFLCIQSEMKQKAADVLTSIDLYIILSNQQACTIFTQLCCYAYNDAKMYSGHKYKPANVHLHDEGRKIELMEYFTTLKTIPSADVEESTTYAHNFTNMRMLSYIPDVSQDPRYVSRLSKNMERLHLTKDPRVQPGSLTHILITLPPALNRTSELFQYHLYGYFIRLINQACCRAPQSQMDIIMEEVVADTSQPGYVEAHIQDMLGEASNSMRLAMTAIQNIIPKHILVRKSWFDTFEWLVTDRSRCIQFVQLIAVYRNIDKVSNRVSASIDPGVVRTMDATRIGILRWFALSV